MTKEEKVTYLKSVADDPVKRATMIVYLFKKSLENPDLPESYLDELLAVVPPPEPQQG